MADHPDQDSDKRPLVVRGACLLDGYERDGEAADILVRDGVIAEIGAPGMPAPGEARVLESAGRLIIPGLVNAHTHSHYTLMKGVPGRWTLELHLHAGGWMSGGREEEDLYTGALLGAAEMLRHGCTSCYDMVLELPAPSLEGIGRVAQAYADAGMRAVISPMVADRTFWESIPGLLEAVPEPLREPLASLRANPGTHTLEACRRLLHDWPLDRHWVGLAVAPAIPLLCSDAFLVACRDLAQDYGVGLHTHLAESKVQAVAGLRRYGESLTAHLGRLDVLGPRMTAAHAVWLARDDLLRLADRGASIAHNPSSNLRLGNGLAAVRSMLDAGLNVGVGTDTSTCSDHLNMFEASRLAAQASRLQTPDYSHWLSAREVLRMATHGSAQALGLERCGRLEAGYKADLVFLDLEDMTYVPLNNALNQVVFSETGRNVRRVMVDGRVVVEDGEFTQFDLRPLLARARETSERIKSRTAPRRAELEPLAEIVGSFCVGLAQTPHSVNRYMEPLG